MTPKRADLDTVQVAGREQRTLIPKLLPTGIPCALAVSCMGAAKFPMQYLMTSFKPTGCIPT